MKRAATFSLFWKIYLTMLLVLFLPMIIIYLTDVTRVFLNRGSRKTPEIFKHLEWHVSELAGQVDSIPDERLIPWIENVKSASDLEIRIERDGKTFFTEGAERLAARPEASPREPFFAAGVSPSGRTRIFASFHPLGMSGFLNFIKIPLSAAVMSILFSFMLVKNLMTPLSKLQDITQRMTEGDFAVRADASVTKRKDEIAALGKSFNKMAERVENLISSQKRLLLDISHEIRSPLQRMNLAAVLLRKKLNPIKEPENKYLERIELEVKRIDDMVEELLTLTRTEKADLTRFEAVRMDDVIRSAFDDAAFENTAAKRVAIAGLPELTVRGDALLLKRALGNVIQNAVRHADPESCVEIDMRRERENETERVVITVRDHGHGVTEDELGKIFLPYYRTDMARERSRGGIGLGLAITK
ncbi:MAG: HAMP domain-containing protein, partial [Synergistaceae bacterium]|nr:HAMP domain-containing protein [Synergistaceae bacterium]